jgi:predicted TIM-barrel fold metal-dependent hydrolase
VLEPEPAVRLSREANDWMGEVSGRYPTRFAGFAAVPTPDPGAAVDELTRAVEELGLKGGLINGHTHGIYLDDERFDPLLARFARLKVPLYIHPAYAPKPIMETYFGPYPELAGAAWGWAIDTGTHLLRIMASGAFDRHPELKVIIGHMGEMIPFHLKRIDRASRWTSSKMQRTVSEYMRDNVFITTGAVFQSQALVCAVLALGIDNILFSVDEPFEDNFEAVEWLKNVPLSDQDLEKLAHGNAERLLGL